MTKKAMSVTELASPCPHCGSGRLTPAAHGTALCLECRRCWRVEAGMIRWVSPARCAGCSLRELCSEPAVRGDGIAVLSAPVRRRCRSHPACGVLELAADPLPPSA